MNVESQITFPDDVRLPETFEEAPLCANFLPSRPPAGHGHRSSLGRARRWPRLTPRRGIAYYREDDARLIKDTSAAHDSDWFASSSLSTTILAHPQGHPGRRQAAHPFARELGGHAVLAHNGTLERVHDHPASPWATSVRSKKGRRCKKGPLCGLVPVVHGRAPRATRRALNRLTRRRAREGPVGPPSLGGRFS